MGTLIQRTHQYHTRVHQRKRPWASDSGAAVHHSGPVVLPQGPRLPHFKEEVKERCWGLRDTEIWPRGVMKVVDFSLLPGLREQTEVSLAGRLFLLFAAAYCVFENWTKQTLSNSFSINSCKKAGLKTSHNQINACFHIVLLFLNTTHFAVHENRKISDEQGRFLLSDGLRRHRSSWRALVRYPETLSVSLWHSQTGTSLVVSKAPAYTNVLQLQHSGGVVGLGVFWQQPDQQSGVSEGHLALLGCGPVLSTLLLSHTERDSEYVKPRDKEMHPTGSRSWPRGLQFSRYFHLVITVLKRNTNYITQMLYWRKLSVND